eukprot:795120-Amorphochlora_amoeboformis.AAC.1
MAYGGLASNLIVQTDDPCGRLGGERIFAYLNVCGLLERSKIFGTLDVCGLLAGGFDPCVVLLGHLSSPFGHADVVLGAI